MSAGRHHDSLNPHRSGIDVTVEVGDCCEVFYDNGGEGGYPALDIQGGNISVALIPRSLVLDMPVTECDARRWAELAEAVRKVADDIGARWAARAAAHEMSAGSAHVIAGEVNTMSHQMGSDIEAIEASEATGSQPTVDTDPDDETQADEPGDDEQASGR